MTTLPPPESNIGPERAGPPPEPKTARPISDLRQDAYTTDEALEAFESLLLTAATVPVTGNLLEHPLVLVQGAKALIGLAPDRPSQALMQAALGFCADLTWTPFERERLVGDPEQLGLTVSVADFEDALADGDSEAAVAQLGRIMMVSDSRQFLFDILLEQAAGDPRRATTLLPFVHSCQRAYYFVGHLNLGDFIIPALEAVASETLSAPVQADTVQRETVPGDTVTPWEVLERLPAGPPELLLLAAHSAQIMADEHVKADALADRLGRTLAAMTAELPTAAPMDPIEGTPADLLAAARAGEAGRSGGIGRHLAQSGDRSWILEVIDAMGEISPQLLLWADATRMLLRVAPEEQRGAVGDVAGNYLAATTQLKPPSKRG